MVVATMVVVMLGAMCRYNDVSRLRWRNVKIEDDKSCFHITFEKRKNAHFMQGNKVTVVVVPQGGVCPRKLLLMLRAHTGGTDDAFIFRGFNRRLVKSSQERNSPDVWVNSLHTRSFLLFWRFGLWE